MRASKLGGGGQSSDDQDFLPIKVKWSKIFDYDGGDMSLVQMETVFCLSYL